MKKFIVLATFVVATVLASGCVSTLSAPEEIYPGYEWREVSAGVFLHTRKDPFAGPVDGNSIVIVNEKDVVVFDTHINPAAARAVVAKIKSTTDNPVSYVINSHWHDDHINGNATFKDAFPDAVILAHSYTAQRLEIGWKAFEEGRIAAYDAVTVEVINKAADDLAATNPDQAISYRVYGGYVDALKPELPDMKLAFPDQHVDDTFEIDGGNRRIEVKFVGRGNTGGDLIAWLPNEKILIAGDILVAPVPYAFDSPIKDWIKTLEQLDAFDAAMILPGHGKAQESEAYLHQLGALLKTTLTRVAAAQENGATLDTLSEFVDLDDQQALFIGDDPYAMNAWSSYYVAPGLKSAWISLGFDVPTEDPTEDAAEDSQDE